MLRRGALDWLAKLIALTAWGLSGEVMSTEFSIDPVFFKEGAPAAKDDITTSMLDFQTQARVLKNDADAINSLGSSYVIQIIGHSDSDECKGSQCDRLSLLRAQFIYRWMLANGVERGRLLLPIGRGHTDPVANNETPEGRSRNRFVEFQIVPARTSGS